MLKTEFSKLLQPDQRLNANPLAKGLYLELEKDNFTISGDPERQEDRLIWMSKILPLSLAEDDVPSVSVHSSVKTQHLFRNVSIKGVKKIPKSDFYRRLDFCNQKGNPVSTVIMGENGVGKSSFFGSLEYAGIGEMKTAQIYGQNEEEYIKNAFTGRSDISVIVKTSKENLIVDASEPKPHCQAAFYISEWDIREIEKKPNFGSYIFSQLGIQDFNLLLSFLLSTKRLLNENLDAYKTAKSNVRTLRVNVESLKLILSKKGTLSDEQIRNILSRPVPQFPDLIIDNHLVNNHQELVNTFKDDIISDPAYSYYTESVKDLCELPLEKAVEELEEVIDYYKKVTNWVTKNRVKDKIEKCRRSRDGYERFKTDMNVRISEFLTRTQGSVESLTELAFTNSANLATSKFNWENSKEYTIILTSADPDQTVVYLEDTIEALLESFHALVKKWIKDIIQPTMERLFSEYFDDKKNDKIEITYSETTRVITANLTIKEYTPSGTGRTAPIKPHAYFNTFRFKMFVVSLKIALACCAKSIYGINWPIVIDDVFNSSDFGNRSKMDRYIGQICEAYNKLEQLQSMPMQLIFFTQDDVIGAAVFRGLRGRRWNAKLLRLHDFRSFSDSDVIRAAGDVPYVNIGSELDSCSFD